MISNDQTYCQTKIKRQQRKLIPIFKKHRTNVKGTKAFNQKNKTAFF